MSDDDAHSTALVVIERASAQEVFTDPTKVGGLLAQLRNLVGSEIYTADTPEGRARIKDIERKLKKTKAVGDGIGKDLVADLKDLPKRIDAGRKLFRDGIDNLVAEIRAPLTEYEAEQDRIKQEQAAAERREQERQHAVDAAIQRLAYLLTDYVGQHSTVIRQAIDDLAWPDPEFFGDRLTEAQNTWGATIAKMENLAEQAEALEKADADRLARDAADQASRREQEASRQRELAAQVAAQRAEDERKAAELRAQEAEAREAQAKADAERQKQLAREQAAEEERQRLADQQAEERKEAERRAADEEHRKGLNRAALNGLLSSGIMQMIQEVIAIGDQDKLDAEISDAQAEILNKLIADRLKVQADTIGKRIIASVARGKIPHMTINY